MNITGYQRHYFCDIFDCYLAVHTDLIPGIDDPLVVWADSENFDPKSEMERNLLQEPMVSYIIADKLQWRILP